MNNKRFFRGRMLGMQIKGSVSFRKSAVARWMLCIVALLMPALKVFAQQPPSPKTAGTHLVIYEVAGAGGLTGSNYRQDTIILFNPTSAAIACPACAIQYHSGTGATTGKWTVYKLPSITIPSGGYYMIAGSAVTAATIGAVAPIPYDYELQSIETSNNVDPKQNILASTAASIALTTNQTAITGNGTSFCGTSKNSVVLDMVGYGSSTGTNSSTSPTPANCYEGSGYAYYDGSSAYGRQLGITRSNACVDTDDNTQDFVNTGVTFFNSTSTATRCPAGTQLSAAFEYPLSSTSYAGYVGGPVTFAVQVTPAMNPGSTISSVQLRLDSPYYQGQALPMYDDGSNGDAKAGDGTYTLTATIPVTTAPGFTYPTNVTIKDSNGDTAAASAQVAVGVPPAAIPLTLYEVAGGGGSTTSSYSQDTIILFNPTASTVSCSTCSMQLHSGASNTDPWSVYQLPPLSIPAGGYYMIAASAAGSGAPAPVSYDYSLGSIEGKSGGDLLSASVGVVALANSIQPLTATSSSLCGTGTQLADLVGYGSNTATDSTTTPTPATCYVGKNYAYYDGSMTYGSKMGIVRRNACVNTPDNLADWVNTPVVYLNSSSTPTVCPTGKQIGATVAATPSLVGAGGSGTFTATVTGATQPDSTGIKANLDFDAPYFGAQAQPMYDDGTHGDVTAGDGTYTLTTTVPASLAVGSTYPVNVTVSDANGDAYTGSTAVSIAATGGNSSLRIVAFYGAGNLSKSMYARDTVILFNPTQQPITMNNWSLQIGGTTGSFTTVYKLPVVTLPSGGYYAIAGSGVKYISSSGCTSTICNLTYPYDYQLKTIEGTATDTDNDLSSTGTALALVSNQTALGSGCPLTSPSLVDLVGVGASDGSAPVTCFAGSNYALYTPSTTNGVATNINGIVYAYATVRKNKCANTFDNANDFLLGYIDFENSQSHPDVCPTGPQLGIAGTISPSPAGVLDPVTVSARLMGAMGSTALKVTADLSNLGLSATEQLYDDGTHGDPGAGDGVYTLATSAQGGTPGSVPGLILNAVDAQGNAAHNTLPFTLLAGGIGITAKTTSADVVSGDVATFPITLTSFHGYNGVLGIACTGTPNANSLGVPVATQCTASPSEVTLSPDGTATLSIAIATGLTTTAGSRNWQMALLVLLATMPIALAVPRGRRMFTALVLFAGLALTLNITGCGKASSGLGNLKAQPGTYTYTVTATDSNIATVTQSITFTVNVR